MSKIEKTRSELLLKCRITPKGHLSYRIVEEIPDTKIEDPTPVSTPDLEPCQVCTPDAPEENYCVLPERNNPQETEQGKED